MLEAIGHGLLLWARNIPLLSALTLTVWLPGNIALNYAAWQSEAESSVWSSFWLATCIESVFGPICIGAAIYAFDRRWQNRRVGYADSMRVGIGCWGRLFVATLVADILIGLGCLLFVVPGIILSLRYSLLGMAVILEDRRGESARLRSADLMRGRMWAVFGIAVVAYGLILATLGTLYLVLDTVYESTAMTDVQYYMVATGIDCVLDLLSIPVLGILFCIYAHASNREKCPEILDDRIDASAVVSSAPVDDGNPYLPPSTL